MIHVIAVLTAQPGQRAALLAAFHDNLAAVRAEEGCLEYSLAVPGAKSPASFGEEAVVVVEKWASPAALAAHAAAPHMQAFGARTRELVASRAIHVLTPA
ncbi:putative quinol monooxygenase [Teichococcus cervicalis]|uniref:Antibiotic biosynthesis monooxygenase n=1 Tax=Pseudoroseomonas cervicalis ATCC 49957 TaxID=525371 RepID=D5RK84_9PROT|nr:antibiotic biosynthesis monooxygenase [Pseudoroseomonas cervicalis]EFH12288.1 antibiotic biosynthesis monooxygenase [Pseudoroseomonas cervicalis ATCC 49957]